MGGFLEDPFRPFRYPLPCSNDQFSLVHLERNRSLVRPLAFDIQGVRRNDIADGYLTLFQQRDPREQHKGENGRSHQGNCDINDPDRRKAAFKNIITVVFLAPGLGQEFRR